MAKLADVLLTQGVLTPDQLQQCLQFQGSKGGGLGGAAIAQGLATERQILDLLGLPLPEPIEDFIPEAIPPRLAELVPVDVARELRCLPVHDNGEVLSVAFANEVNDLELERLSEKANRQIQAFLTESTTLEAGHGLLYGGGAPETDGLSDLAVASGDSAPPDASAGPEDEESALESLDLGGETTEAEPPPEGEDGSVPEIADFKGVMSGALDEVQVVQEQVESESTAYGIEIEANSPPVVKLVNGMLIKSLNLHASDIHIEPQEKELLVRVRVDGELHKLMRLPKSVTHKIASRIKIMANLNIAEKRIPQDGRFKVQLGPGRVVEFRLSTLPSAYGEKIVMRVLGGSKIKGDVPAMGFSARDLECVLTALKAPWGLILVTGPTGSGKTTTLYTMLKSLNTPDRNVMTAEDPIEYNLQGLTQVPINPITGLTFEKVLRAFLRQDPDVILVGEIRDKETAEIAAKAAMTGHMVLSTLHTNDAPSTVLRLKNIGVEPFLLASALKLVIAQRLVRLLCPNCKVPAKLTAEDKIGFTPAELEGIDTVYKSKGCEECHHMGCKGRRPVFEVMPLRSDKMKASVLDPDGAAVERQARSDGMKNLREAALGLVREGLIAFQEACKVGVAG